MTEGNGNGGEVAIRPAKPLSARDPVQLAQHFAASGYFQDATQMSQAVVKIVYGEELGIAPMGAMQGIHIIEGKPSLSANLLATLIKKHEHYDYDPVQITDEGAEITFTRDGKKIGTSVFGKDDAKRAGLLREGSGWMKYPQAMYFARALSQGIRWFCPDVTSGAAAYVPEELGAEVNAQGEILSTPGDGPPVVAPEEPPAAAEETDGEVVASQEQVDQVVEALNTLSLPFSRLCLLLGSIGVEAPKLNRADSISKCIRELAPDRADALVALLHREGDPVEPESDAVEDQPTDTSGFQPQSGSQGTGAGAEESGEEVTA